MNETSVPDNYLALNVQPLVLTNGVDQDENPTGGGVRGQGVIIDWQDGPRGKDAEGNLAPSNGAFVEDAIYAALQRLEFFQASKYETQYNADAIDNLKKALTALDGRRKDRADRGVEGQHAL